MRLCSLQGLAFGFGKIDSQTRNPRLFFLAQRSNFAPFCYADLNRFRPSQTKRHPWYFGIRPTKLLMSNLTRSFFSEKLQPATAHGRYLLYTVLNGLIGFTFFRLLAFLQEWYQLQYLPENGRFWLILQSFLMGLRFDLATIAWMMLLPWALLVVAFFIKRQQVVLWAIAFTLIIAAFFYGFFCCAADLPYFHHFNTRTTMAILVSAGTGDSDFLWEMVWGEWRYYWTLAPLLLTSGWFLWRQWRGLRKYLPQQHAREALEKSWWELVLLSVLLLVAVWGQFSDKPIDTATAWFSDYAFPNQLALNPCFTFTKSWLAHFDPEYDRVHFMPDQEAIERVRQYLGITQTELPSPIARPVTFDTLPARKPNVVIVIMESMSAAKMGRYGNPNGLTPFMDSLAQQSLSFDSLFSVGIHTFAGIYGTLYSMPVVKRKHPLVEMKPHAGMASALKQHGYQTIYFTTHDEEFDHVGKFLRANGFDRIVAKPDYPKEKILSALGVPDDYLYHHAIGEFNELYRNGKPFFGAIMTGSDHGPYVIPEYFKPRHRQRILGIVEYVDWSVRQFLQEAARQPWFENTIFVFTGDHGVTVEKHYDLPTSFNHVPCIVYAPALLGPPKAYGMVASQMDIFPTLMGMLHLPYLNNTLGIDLLHQQRPYAITYADDKFAVIDKEYLYVWREFGVESLYHHRSLNPHNLIPYMPERAEQMRTFGQSMFQAAQFMRESGLTGVPEAAAKTKSFDTLKQ